jgi:hypothetical protein
VVPEPGAPIIKMGFTGLGMVVTVCETIKILLLYGNRKLKKEGAEAREKEKKEELVVVCIFSSTSLGSIVPLKR